MPVSAKTGFVGSHYFVAGSTVYSTHTYPTSDMTGTKCMDLTPFSEAPTTGLSGVFFDNGTDYGMYKITVNANGTSVFVALGESHMVRIYDATYGSIAREISALVAYDWALTNVWNSLFGDYFWTITSNVTVSGEKDGHYYSDDELPEGEPNILASINGTSTTSPRVCVCIPRNNP